MRLFRILSAAFLILMSSLALAQANGYRLIMKDGSYQIITKYEVKNDRVRFYSAERHDWEEVPASMVDWVATEKWKRDYGPAETGPVVVTNPNDPGQVEAAKIDAEERAAREAEKERIPMILPGLRLPDESGVWVLDTFDGQPELAHMTQTNGDLNRAYEHSVLAYEIGSKRGARELIRVDGFAAKVEVHVAQPVFYVSLDRPKDAPDPGPLGPVLTVNTHGASSVKDDKGAHSSPDSRYVILALNGNPHERWADAEQVDATVHGPTPAYVTETTKEILPGGYWMKVTPKSPLLIGQYALVEVLAPNAVNLDAWAFGVNPTAPENTDTVGKINQ
ncbi:MAG TPA: hypothetical protein VHZ09_20320 [Acidobacteriaceae bacterium]|jgi:hypothetical protein|nr:hypothetical protein [Acidobacteriaceae bacterium]